MAMSCYQCRTHAARIILSRAMSDMPSPDPARFRAAMATLPTGVTIVSAAGPEGPAGATANAVCSLSIEPMLMLACLDRGSRPCSRSRLPTASAISVLHGGQEPIARAFATKAPVAEKWEGVAWSERDGIPAIDGALAWIACELRDVVAGGDHVIVTGEVRTWQTGEGPPLVFHGGEYRPPTERDLRQACKGRPSQPVAIARDRQTSCMHALSSKACEIRSVEKHRRDHPEVVEGHRALRGHAVPSASSRTSVGISLVWCASQTQP